jgi:hypothetical protein
MSRNRIVTSQDKISNIGYKIGTNTLHRYDPGKSINVPFYIPLIEMHGSMVGISDANTISGVMEFAKEQDAFEQAVEARKKLMLDLEGITL